MVTSAQPLLRDQIDIVLRSFRKKKLQDHLALRSQEFVEIVELKDISYLHVDNGCKSIFQLKYQADDISLRRHSPHRAISWLGKNTFLHLHTVMHAFKMTINMVLSYGIKW